MNSQVLFRSVMLALVVVGIGCGGRGSGNADTNELMGVDSSNGSRRQRPFR